VCTTPVGLLRRAQQHRSDAAAGQRRGDVVEIETPSAVSGLDDAPSHQRREVVQRRVDRDRHEDAIAWLGHRGRARRGRR
jgi:hypothetical protein